MIKHFWVLLILVLITNLCIFSQNKISRGPYLQKGSATAVTVIWHTGWFNTSSKVWYGTTLGKFTKTISDPKPKTKHVLRVTNLKPNTKYYYKIGSDQETFAGGDKDHYFVTSPAVGSRTPVRIWALGDSGTGNFNALAVKNAYLKLAKKENREADVWLMLGDNAYSLGTQWEYQYAVFDTYPQILKNKVLWSTRGNHDVVDQKSNPQVGPYFDIFDLPTGGECGGTPSGTEQYYSFDYGNVHFVCLDSISGISMPGNPMLKWLEEDLANTNQDWIIAFFHHPPYTKGSHDSDYENLLIQMRQHTLPILEAGDVDLVLTGHSHSYERSFLIDGHYGYSDTFDASKHVVDGGDGRENSDGAYQKPKGASNKGAVYIVAGSSGKISDAPFGHPIMFAEWKKLGSLVIDVAGDRMDVRFLREKEDIKINDYFTMKKVTRARTNAPDIAIKSAQNNLTLTAPANLTIAAFASSVTGNIRKVVFYQNGKKIYQTSKAPYECKISSLAPGKYVFSVRAQNQNKVFGKVKTLKVVVKSSGKKKAFIAKGSNWKYFDKGHLPAINWHKGDYNDNNWAIGPAQLGYGDNDEKTIVSFGNDVKNKFPTTYFRKTFVLKNKEKISYLLLQLLQDDGAVVYLNGHEIHRVNMPKNKIEYSTYAAQAIIGKSFANNIIASKHLKDGKNTLAVEVHQSYSKSAALSFDLALIGLHK